VPANRESSMALWCHLYRLYSIRSGLPNVLSVAQSIDIMATLALMFYYYMWQIQSLLVDSSMTWMKKYMDWTNVIMI